MGLQKECNTPIQRCRIPGIPGVEEAGHILTYPDPSKTFILDTDASDVSIGAINSKETVIVYSSQTLTKAKTQHRITRRKLLALVYFTKLYTHCMSGPREPPDH